MTTQIADSFRAANIWGSTFGGLPKVEHPEILPLSEPHLSKRDLLFGYSHYDSTACERGYVASWAIRDSSLFLDELFGYIKLRKDAPVPATWYKGWLIVDYGATLLAEFPLQPVLENCRAYAISDGVVRRHLDRPPVKGDGRDAMWAADEFARSLGNVT